MFRPGVAVAALAGALVVAFPPQALAQWRVGGNAAVVSDYVYRGFSRSDNEPVPQADIHLARGGLTIGAWATRVRLLPRRSSSEFDLYAHWRRPLTENLTAGVAATYYRFPGDPRPVSYNYTEFSAALDWQQRVRLEVAWTPRITLFAPYYGPQPARQSWSTELTLAQPLRWGLVGVAGIGRFDAPQLEGSTYHYGNAGISRDFGAWHAELSYFFASAGASRVYALGPAGRPVVATLAWHF